MRVESELASLIDWRRRIVENTEWIEGERSKEEEMQGREKEKEREKKEAVKWRGGSQADKAPSDSDEEEEEEESEEMEESEEEEEESERRVSLRRRTSERAGWRDWEVEIWRVTRWGCGIERRRRRERNGRASSQAAVCVLRVWLFGPQARGSWPLHSLLFEAAKGERRRKAGKRAADG